MAFKAKLIPSTFLDPSVHGVAKIAIHLSREFPDLAVWDLTLLVADLYKVRNLAAKYASDFSCGAFLTQYESQVAERKVQRAAKKWLKDLQKLVGEHNLSLVSRGNVNGEYLRMYGLKSTMGVVEVDS